MSFYEVILTDAKTSATLIFPTYAKSKKKAKKTAAKKVKKTFGGALKVSQVCRCLP